MRTTVLTKTNNVSVSVAIETGFAKEPVELSLASDIFLDARITVVAVQHLLHWPALHANIVILSLVGGLVPIIVVDVDLLLLAHAALGFDLAAALITLLWVVPLVEIEEVWGPLECV